uniref:Uncharacterized protein n=1 Tax=Timema cristinae TaxID=61476 RepID=A0A7R9GW18_TIMCR|nr:unnamed protein product [Timema cristinae]
MKAVHLRIVVFLGSVIISIAFELAVNYVLHSSGQLFSHKRKHERQDSEMAYRKFKLAQSMIKTFNDGPQLSSSMVHAYNEQLSQHSDTSVSSIQTSVIQQCPGGVGISESRDNYSNGENSSDEGHSPMLQNTQQHSTFPTKYLPLEAGHSSLVMDDIIPLPIMVHGFSLIYWCQPGGGLKTHLKIFDLTSDANTPILLP